MTTTIVTGPLKLAGVIAPASLPVIWWAADQADQTMHAAAAAAVAILAVVVAWLLGPSEPLPGLDPARRAAARYALLIAVVYLWGSVALLVSYYLTDQSWYHAYQYAIYLALPGLISLYVFRRHLRPAAAETIVRDLDTGHWMAWAQLVVMLGVLVYMWLSREVAMGLAGENANWAAVSIMLAGALALVVVSVLAIMTDRRLGRG